MPIVQFRGPTGEEVRGKTIPYPKRIEDPKSWVAEVRKIIPTVPDPRKTDWFISTFDATLDIVLIEMCNSVGQRCRIGILRESGAKSKSGTLG